jgi:acyl-CoA reductase-like NAD-dependent aldehyde dehydrogenase
MLNIPVLRWGKPHTSLDQDEVVHFHSGETLARVSQAIPGLVSKDMRKAHRAREVLREIPIAELIEMMKKAGVLYRDATLPMGDGEQTPDDFARQQSATTGLPEHMCKGNMAKNEFVLREMGTILEALTRGLDLEVLNRGHGEERGNVVSYQAESSTVGMVLPSNSPGVHTLWLPIIPLQIGLVLKPGPQEPWTPYRMAAAFAEAGVPREVISIYPGGPEMGAAVLEHCGRSMIFGGQPTVDAYRDNPRVQVHGPGYSKVLIGDDVVDQWEDYIDLIVDSVYLNSGRGCINCSGVWASRHTEEIAEAIASRIGPIEVKPPEDPEAAIAAFTVPGQPQAIAKTIEKYAEESGVTDVTAAFGARLVEHDRCAYIRPWVLHCDSPDRAAANTEFMFPFVSVVECPQEQMIGRIGGTLVASAITEDTSWRRELIDATNIDRLNLGAIPTIKLDWLQPHEGNIIQFLYRARSFQMS